MGAGMNNLTDVAWAAGFFDGEGSVMLSQRGSNGSFFTLYATVGQVNKRPLLKLQQIFGGVVKHASTTTAGNPFHVWRVAATKAGLVLEEMLPYIVDKHEEISIALEMQNLKQKGKKLGTIKYSADDHAKFAEVFERFKQVKKLRRMGQLEGEFDASRSL
jgi:hypothetical protein